MSVKYLKFQNQEDVSNYDIQLYNCSTVESSIGINLNKYYFRTDEIIEEDYSNSYDCCTCGDDLEIVYYEINYSTFIPEYF